MSVEDAVQIEMTINGRPVGEWVKTGVSLEDNNVALTTVEGIEIATVGEEWPAATGAFTLTSEHIASVIASQADPAIKSPRVKLGHNSALTPDDPADPFSGMPVFGKFVNLRTNEAGTQLIGDIVGIPKWAAEVLPYAWPSRSGEWLKEWDNFGTAKARYPMCLSAVALLGVELPGITTIEDLPAFFTAEGPEGVKVVVDGAKVRASARKKEDMPTTTTHRAGNVVITSVDSADVRSSFFSDFATLDSGRYWWWPTQVFINPQAVIAEDDDTGNLYFVEYEVGSDDAINWKEPVEVKHQFVEADGDKVLAGVREQEPVARFTTAAEVRPKDRIKTNDKKETETVAKTAIDIQGLRSRLGLSEEQLPDDATDEQINEALKAPTGDPAPPTNLDPATPGSPNAGEEEDTADTDGKTVRVSKKVWDETQARLERVETAERLRVEKETTARRDRKASDAVRTGRIAPSEKEYYRELLDIDETKTSAKLDALTPGKVPVDERGTDPAPDHASVQGTGLIPELNRNRDKQEA
jgi:hypothetical protein